MPIYDMHNFFSNEWYLSESKSGVKLPFLIFFYSSASMASQVIQETTPDDIALIEDDDDMSECTLKDFAKKVPASSRKGKRI